jgi:hypothetical protein
MPAIAGLKNTGSSVPEGQIEGSLARGAWNRGIL